METKTVDIEKLKVLIENGYTFNELKQEFNLTNDKLAKAMRKINIHLKDYKMDYTVFDNIDNEEKSYWLGFLYADGYVSSKEYRLELSLKADDENHLKKFLNFVKWNRKIGIKIQDSKCNGKIYKRCRWQIRNQHIWNRLNELGCVPNKSLILKFPSKDIFQNESLINDFIRGYIDGDGYLGFLNKKLSNLYIQIIGTKEFLEGIASFYNLNANIVKKVKKSSQNTYVLNICGENCRKISELLYKDKNIYLDRKYEKYKIAVSYRNI